MSTRISSPSLEDWFRRLEIGDILAFVTEQRQEDLTLDFKLAPSNFANREDRKTLAEAMSGFANSSGGLIVWGIDARKDADGIDCAQRPVPLSDGRLFLSLVLSSTAETPHPQRSKASIIGLSKAAASPSR